MASKKTCCPLAAIGRYASQLAALGAGQRLQIVRLLLAAHPAGMCAGAVQEELGMPASTLSHHLEKLKQAGLIESRREGTFLRYVAQTAALRAIIDFLYAECCTRVEGKE